MYTGGTNESSKSGFRTAVLNWFNSRLVRTATRTSARDLASLHMNEFAGGTRSSMLYPETITVQSMDGGTPLVKEISIGEPPKLAIMKAEEVIIEDAFQSTVRLTVTVPSAPEVILARPTHRPSSPVSVTSVFAFLPLTDQPSLPTRVVFLIPD